MNNETKKKARWRKENAQMKKETIFRIKHLNFNDLFLKNLPFFQLSNQASQFVNAEYCLSLASLVLDPVCAHTVKWATASVPALCWKPSLFLTRGNIRIMDRVWPKYPKDLQKSSSGLLPEAQFIPNWGKYKNYG